MLCFIMEASSKNYLDYISQKTISRNIFIFALLCIDAAIFVSIIIDSSMGNYFPVITNIILFLIGIILFVLIFFDKIKIKYAVSFLLASGIADLQAQIVQWISNIDLKILDINFGNAVIILLCSITFIIGLSKNVGILLTAMATFDMIIIKVIQNDNSLFFYTIIIPIVIIAVTISIYIFRLNYERQFVMLYGSQTGKPKLDMTQFNITKLERVCIEYFSDKIDTKEIAFLEKCKLSTIQSRFGSIFKKMNIRNRQQLGVIIGEFILDWGDDVDPPEKT